MPRRTPKAKVSWKPQAKLHSLPPDIRHHRGLEASIARVEPVHGFRGGTKEALAPACDEFTSAQAQALFASSATIQKSTAPAICRPICISDISVRSRLRLAVQSSRRTERRQRSFLDQLITWRELSINLVRFNPNYDNFECGEAWAHRTLAEHCKDPRPVLYTQKQLENAETYDPLWNAAQMQMVNCRLDAQLHAHVLGQEDSGVEPHARRGLPDRRAT